MKYPLQITEPPHRGNARTWTLYDKDHLKELIQSASATSNYDEWCAENDYVEWAETENGDFVAVNDRRADLETYLDWLRHDLQSLDVQEAPHLTALAPAIKKSAPKM